MEGKNARKKAHELEVSMQIGKSGITDTVVEQIIKQIKKRKVIKVKFLASAVEGNKEELFEELAEKTNTELIHKIGFTIVLKKK